MFRSVAGTDRSFLSRWVPPVLWMGFIYILSTGSFSADMTGGLVYPILKYMFPGMGDNVLIPLHILIRKAGHVNNYGILSFLLFRALQGRVVTWKAALSAVVVSFLYAAVDEYHQGFVSVRTSSPWDVALDTFGAAFMQGALWLHRKL